MRISRNVVAFLVLMGVSPLAAFSEGNPGTLSLGVMDSDRFRPEVEIGSDGVVGREAKPIAVVLGQRIELRFSGRMTIANEKNYFKYELDEVSEGVLVQVDVSPGSSMPVDRAHLENRTAVLEARGTGRAAIVIEPGFWQPDIFSIEVMSAKELATRTDRDGPNVLRFNSNIFLHNNSSIRRSDEYLIQDAETWKGVWERIHLRLSEKPDLPAVDFDRQTAIAIFMGECNSSGYSVEIVSVKDLGKTIEVHYEKLGTIESGRMYLASVTNPFEILVVPKLNKKVKFSSRDWGNLRGCSSYQEIDPS